MFSFRNIVRNYARWTHRRPTKVILPNELNDRNAFPVIDLGWNETVSDLKINAKPSAQIKDTLQENEAKTFLENKYIIKPTKNTHKSNNKKAVDNILDEPKRQKTLISDDESELNYIKLGLGDGKMSSLMLTVKSRKRRDQTKQILLEGKRLVRDALIANLKPEAILFSKVEHLRYLSPWLKQYNNAVTSKEHLFYRVTYTDLKMWSDVVTSPGIMALFERPPTVYNSNKSDKLDITLPLTIICDNIREPSNLGAIIRTCAALPCHELILTKGCCDPWDSKVLRGAAGGHFRLSLKTDVEWETITETLPKGSLVLIADNKPKTDTPDIAMIEYDKPTYKKDHNHIIVILGGETQGISNDAYNLCRTTKGSRINIPLAREVDSLNSATALSILTFEIRRQLSQTSI